MLHRLFVLAAIAAGLLAAGCKSDTAYYGEGPLVLSARAAKTIGQYGDGKEAIRANLHVALDKRGRSIGGVYCPVKELHACRGESSLAQKAVLNCNKDGRYDCALYSIEGHIVWRGPVYVRDYDTGQQMPYHGIWPVQTDWRKSGAVRLVAHEGTLTLEGLSGAGPCPLELDPRSNSGGRFTVRCGGDTVLRGEYDGAGIRAVSGFAVDREGREARFEIDLKRGAKL